MIVWTNVSYLEPGGGGGGGFQLGNTFLKALEMISSWVAAEVIY